MHFNASQRATFINGLRKHVHGKGLSRLLDMRQEDDADILAIGGGGRISGLFLLLRGVLENPVHLHVDLNIG